MITDETQILHPHHLQLGARLAVASLPLLEVLQWMEEILPLFHEYICSTYVMHIYLCIYTPVYVYIYIYICVYIYIQVL